MCDDEKLVGTARAEVGVDGLARREDTEGRSWADHDVVAFRKRRPKRPTPPEAPDAIEDAIEEPSVSADAQPHPEVILRPPSAAVNRHTQS